MQSYFPEGYTQSVRAAIVVGLVYQCTGYLVTQARHRFFGKEFMNKNFGEEHRKYFGKDPAVGGYPDNGEGRYSEQLTFGEWHRFSQAVRAYNNFSEWILSTILSILLCGLFFPTLGGLFGYGIAVGRILYAVGYMINPDKRIVGAAIAEILVLINFILIGYGVYKL